MEFDKEKSNWPNHLSNNSQTDHLTYLSLSPSLFEDDEEDEEILQKNLLCATCGNPVTKVGEKVKIRGRHDYTFTNLGYPIQLGCFRSAPGCIGYGGISHGYSWFRGYAWQIQLCKNCSSQLGWIYLSEGERFYALVFRMLREEEAKEDKDTESEGE